MCSTVLLLTPDSWGSDLGLDPGFRRRSNRGVETTAGVGRRVARMILLLINSLLLRRLPPIRAHSYCMSASLAQTSVSSQADIGLAVYLTPQAAFITTDLQLSW